MRLGVSAILAAAALLGACVPRTAAVDRPAVVPQARPYTTAGLESVIGRTARALVAQFGRPDLDLREGPARKLQFLAPACVLDAYLYPPRGGGEAIGTHIHAPLPHGPEMERAPSMAALGARQQDR